MIKGRSKAGDPLVKAIALKVFEPGNKKFTRKIMRAPNGQGFLMDTVERILFKTASAIEKQYPGEEFRLVVVGPAAFNFVHEGRASL